MKKNSKIEMALGHRSVRLMWLLVIIILDAVVGEGVILARLKEVEIQ